MILKQTLEEPVNGYWDGGKKQVFEWSIENWENPNTDKKGEFVKVGSWGANHWFNIAKSKTIKQTLANAKRHLRATTKIRSSFEYVE